MGDTPDDIEEKELDVEELQEVLKAEFGDQIEADRVEEIDLSEAALELSDNFVDEVVTNFTVGHTENRMFFISLRKEHYQPLQIGTDIEIGGQQIVIGTLHLSPKNLKELRDVLDTQINRFEDKYGEIELEDDEGVNEE